jgi:hypothetical protein
MGKGRTKVVGKRSDFREAVLAAALLLLPISAANAATTAAVDPITGAAVAGYPGNIAVGVPVTAKVTPDCGFDPGNLPSGTLNWGELKNAFDQKVFFGLRCGTPLNVGVVSTNGGLLATGVTVATGYTAQRNYQVELFLQGTPSTNDATCLASNLGSVGTCTFRGPATTTASSGGLYLNSNAINGGG